MGKIAYLTQNLATGQYTLHCMGKEIAYTLGATVPEHEEGKRRMLKTATKKGYTILSK